MAPGGITEKANNENASPANVLCNRNSNTRSNSSPAGKSLLRKSLIPKPVTSPSNDENCGSEVQQKPRRPLSQVQNTDSPRVGGGTPKSGKVSAPAAKEKGVRKSVKDGSSMTPVDKLRLSATGVPKTPQNSPVRAKKLKEKKQQEAQEETQTTPKLEEETGNEEVQSIEYWKALAESRRQALEEALNENFELHGRVDELQKQIAEMESIVEEAKKLAVMISEAAEELDESGIAENEQEIEISLDSE